jgi:hypothetical protein
MRAYRIADRTVITATLSAVAVLALHLLFALGIALSPALPRASDAPKPLVLLSELPSIMTVPSAGPLDWNPQLALAPPHPSLPVLPATPDTDGTIVAAADADAMQVSRICRAWPAGRGRHDDAQPPLSVLVRVAEDGRVLDSRLLVGTGAADRDAALQHCLLTLARFTPFRVDGHPVTAWQKVQPLGAASMDLSRRP